MDLKEYDKLRKKISIKDFEGNNKALDKWLFGFSFVGNIGSIFFSYFLLYPALLKAISINLVSGTLGMTLAFLFSITFLSIFEIIKRYLFRNFSSDYVANNKKIKAPTFGWLAVSVAIVVLSFYLSVIGSKNLASTSDPQNTVAQAQVNTQKDSLVVQFERKKKAFESDNQELRNASNALRENISQTPIGWSGVRKDYQSSIDKNTKLIESNQTEIHNIDQQLALRIEDLKTGLSKTKADNATEDSKNILLFVIIAIFAEFMIIGGVYFREWYEFNLYQLNQQKYNKIYERKDRYHALIAFIYGEGKLTIGDKVITGLELKEIVSEKTNIQNSNKFVEEFFRDMDRLGIFSTEGKRRSIASTYNDAQSIIDNYDESLRILENMK